MNVKEQVKQDGFAVVNDVFTDEDINHILTIIFEADADKPTFRKTNDLFAIRQLLKEIPSLADAVFTDKMTDIIEETFGYDFFIVKSIYFNKPATSNWFVSYHQGLTISVDKKTDTDGFGPWTVKQNQFAVQPPLAILQDNFAIRVHLDKTDKENGALKVIPASHTKGIFRPETINWNVEKGGIMIMKPLLLHSSGKTTNDEKRRVIHIEFSRSSLPEDLHWSEYMEIFERLEYSDEFKKELDDTYEAYLKGKIKTFTWEEIKERTNRIIEDK